MRPEKKNNEPSTEHICVTGFLAFCGYQRYGFWEESSRVPAVAASGTVFQVLWWYRVDVRTIKMTMDDEDQRARLVRGPQDTTALVGDRVLLKATYIGRPEPSVRWTKAVSWEWTGQMVQVFLMKRMRVIV